MSEPGLCPHCHGPLPEPPGEFCPNCGRRLGPNLKLRRAVLAVAGLVIVGFGFWQSQESERKGQRESDRMIECLKTYDVATCRDR